MDQRIPFKLVSITRFNSEESIPSQDIKGENLHFMHRPDESARPFDGQLSRYLPELVEKLEKFHPNQ